MSTKSSASTSSEVGSVVGERVWRCIAEQVLVGGVFCVLLMRVSLHAPNNQSVSENCTCLRVTRPYLSIADVTLIFGEANDVSAVVLSAVSTMKTLF